MDEDGSADAGDIDEDQLVSEKEGKVADLQRALQEMIADGTPVTKPKIQAVAEVALNNLQNFKRIVYQIERFVKYSELTLRSAGICVIDSLCTKAHKTLGKGRDVFTPRFKIRMKDTHAALKNIPKADKQLCNRIFREWRKRRWFDVPDLDGAEGRERAGGKLEESEPMHREGSRERRRDYRTLTSKEKEKRPETSRLSKDSHAANRHKAPRNHRRRHGPVPPPRTPPLPTDDLVVSPLHGTMHSPVWDSPLSDASHSSSVTMSHSRPPVASRPIEEHFNHHQHAGEALGLQLRQETAVRPATDPRRRGKATDPRKRPRPTLSPNIALEPSTSPPPLSSSSRGPSFPHPHLQHNGNLPKPNNKPAPSDPRKRRKVHEAPPQTNPSSTSVSNTHAAFPSTGLRIVSIQHTQAPANATSDPLSSSSAASAVTPKPPTHTTLTSASGLNVPPPPCTIQAAVGGQGSAVPGNIVQLGEGEQGKVEIGGLGNRKAKNSMLALDDEDEEEEDEELPLPQDGLDDGEPGRETQQAGAIQGPSLVHAPTAGEVASRAPMPLPVYRAPRRMKSAGWFGPPQETLVKSKEIMTAFDQSFEEGQPRWPDMSGLGTRPPLSFEPVASFVPDSLLDNTPANLVSGVAGLYMTHRRTCIQQQPAAEPTPSPQSIRPGPSRWGMGRVSR